MLILGERYRDLLEAPLKRLTDDILWLPDNPDLDSRLAGHADLNVYYAGNNVFYAAKRMYPALVKKLTNAGYKLYPIPDLGKCYPKDAALCVCRIGGLVIFNPKTAARELISGFHGKQLHVTQGYTRCSICDVTENSIMTSDDVIAEKAKTFGMDVLKLTAGCIELPGFDYGFIGGASIRLDNRRIAFTGHLREHPDSERIMEFLNRHGVEPVFLTDNRIFDIGGAVALP